MDEEGNYTINIYIYIHYNNNEIISFLIYAFVIYYF